jgi:hypothetical protein
MVMMRPKGKPLKIATQVLKNKGVKVPKPDVVDKTKLTGPYLQH